MNKSQSHPSHSLPPPPTIGNDPALRIGLFFGALFLILGLLIPYLPIWLDWAGLTAGEIAIISATPLFLRLGVSPVIALYADRHKAHRNAILCLAVVAIAAIAALLVVRGFWPIFVVAVVFTICVSAIMPLIETVAVEGVKSVGADYGRMRLWGSLAFIGIGFVGGWMVDWQGAVAVVPLLIFATVLTFCSGLLLPKKNGPSEKPVRQTPAPPLRRIQSGPLHRLAFNPVFLVFLISVSAIQGAHGLFYTFGALHWKGQGLSTTWIGTLWALGVMAEVALFAYSGAVIAKFGPVKLLIAGGLAGVVRWLAMSFDPGLELLIPLQLLHGATYGATHIGAIYFMAQSIPEGAAGTAQALYGALAAGLATGAATLASGPLYATFGGYGYSAMAGVAAVGLIAAVALLRAWNGDLLWPVEQDDTGRDVRDAELGPNLPVGPNM